MIGTRISSPPTAIIFLKDTLFPQARWSRVPNSDPYDCCMGHMSPPWTQDCCICVTVNHPRPATVRRVTGDYPGPKAEVSQVTTPDPRLLDESRVTTSEPSAIRVDSILVLGPVPAGSYRYYTRDVSPRSCVTFQVPFK